MKITEIRVKLVDGDPTRQRLRAFCSLTFDNAFVVRDLKVLEGNQGYFVAMPSRKMTFRCPNCRQRNAIGSNYCSQCGMALAGFDPCGNMTDVSPSKLYVDIVH
ncbi:MAG: SpoVG family protein, partial [Thermoguttaceae bacterium]|nr:SpoVG family protein [Thermoguttaceae bacterium]